MQPAVSPFVYRPHVEQGGVTITPDLSIRAVMGLDEAGRASQISPAALSSSPVLVYQDGAGDLRTAFTFTQAAFGLLVGIALVVTTGGLIRQIAAARTAWRYPDVHDHTDQICLMADGALMGSMDQWETQGVLQDGIIEQGTMAVASAGALIEGSGAEMTVSLSLEDRLERTALAARYQILPL